MRKKTFTIFCNFSDGEGGEKLIEVKRAQEEVKEEVTEETNGEKDTEDEMAEDSVKTPVKEGEVVEMEDLAENEELIQDWLETGSPA